MKTTLTTKYTPGPWELKWRPRSIGLELEANRERVAQIYFASPADRALIAAAPEMLEALRDAESTLKRCFEILLDSDISPDFIQFDACSNNIRKRCNAVIAKAEGGDNV